MRSSIEEGRAVYGHVKENAELETVGIFASYLQEGYLMGPDRAHEILYLLRYEVSTLHEEGETHRSLWTVHGKSVEEKASRESRPTSSST